MKGEMDMPYIYVTPKMDSAAVESAVSDWLDAHPEATTTVQDGSITEPKLASALADKIQKVYVDDSGIIIEK